MTTDTVYHINLSTDVTLTRDEDGDSFWHIIVTRIGGDTLVRDYSTAAIDLADAVADLTVLALS